MKYIRFNQIITALCCLLLISCGIDKNLKKGEKFLSLGEYYDAADQFKQAYTKTPAKKKDEATAQNASAAQAPADPMVGKPCPLCGKGVIIKGKTAYGCSNWKSGCQYRQPFSQM